MTEHYDRLCDLAALLRYAHVADQPDVHDMTLERIKETLEKIQ